jgi:hypothetical protein
MNPAAGGNFLDSAIPVKGDLYYGKTGRTAIQGTGSTVGLSWTATPMQQAMSGAISLQSDSLDTSSGSTAGIVSVQQAYLQWDNVTFGLTNTAFEDVSCLCDSIDVLGPIGRPAVKGGQAQVGFMFLRPDNYAKQPTGYYSQISLEYSTPDIDLSYWNTTSFKTTPFETFTRYPDLVWFLRYEDASANLENYHLQFGSVLRDLVVDQSTTTVPQANTFGWGLQLSGAYSYDTGPSCNLRDTFYFSVTGGKGIGHYFNDLNIVSPIDDAVYSTTGASPALVPLTACYMGYTHEWSTYWRSTVSVSYINLTNPVTGFANPSAPKPMPGSTLTYHQGEALGVNLIYHISGGTTPFSFNVTDTTGKPSHGTDAAPIQTRWNTIWL